MKKTKKANINIRVDQDIKQYLVEVLTSNGMSVSNAFQLYIWQIVTQNGIPFKGFVSTKLPVKKGDELSAMDIKFHERYLELKDKLMEKSLRGLEIEADRPLPGDKDHFNTEEDLAMFERHIKKQILKRGFIPGPDCHESYTMQELQSVLPPWELSKLDLSLYIKPEAETQPPQSPMEED